MGKSTKDKRDIYYRQGKAEGYRARSAYKLLHLNEQYGFLGGSEDYALDAAAASSSTSSAAPTDSSEDASRQRFPTPTRVVDLCAAPGSWSQVLSRRLASVPGSHLVAVDLQAMAPLPGVTQIIGDITTSATADAVSIALSDGPSALTTDKGKGKARAQLIVCDGAPDVTGLHDLDEYLQSQLLLAATQITFRLLEVGGTFVAKIFTQHPQAGLGASLGNMDLKGARPATSGALLADQLRPFFDRVDIAKPRSSRLGSVEHFLVCLGFKPPQNLPAGIVGSLAEPALSESREDDAREDLVRYAQKLRSQLQRPTAASQGQAQSQRQLSATLPFVAHGDLSGFDQS